MAARWGGTAPAFDPPRGGGGERHGRGTAGEHETGAGTGQPEKVAAGQGVVALGKGPRGLWRVGQLESFGNFRGM